MFKHTMYNLFRFQPFNIVIILNVEIEENM